ncbi:MAG TPA: hypothetical protein PKW75_06170 [candidate division Zixibacteria bacterium]|nr:hypothetical protein [candidate division Zixibacteria bacterium]MDD4918511.1 hypothetical protein [candidate division Zixibacteria bacterium]MDM7973381.1 hypothetical protein [candidate division Zixibacteria bacterium]HOD67601.1 hypothetical protein [candidate division Zixibacteria bacterium]HOZ07855.1 hypothetical protein [candidate division Zixibacteria bacterium]
MIHPVSRELARSLELIEIAAMVDVFAAAPDKIARRLGARVIECSPMTGVLVPGLDVLVFNRVIGFGLQPAIDPVDVDRCLDHYRAAGVKRFFIQTCPVGAPENARQVLGARGLRWHNNWVKLYRDTSPPPASELSVTVREIGRDQALRFGELVCTAFEWGDAIVEWIATLVGRPRWRIYGAFDGWRMIAGAALFVHGDFGWLDFAATDKDYRASGAQSALLHRRIAEAAALRLRTLVLETAEQTAERGAPSFRNVQRFDFEVAYVRPNFLWSREPAPE